jgi:peptidoglycan/LPS O-acetylase OafA/YrhL
MCYSLYLVHWPVVQAVGLAVDSLGINNSAGILLIRIPSCVAMTILAGRVFHRLIERRFWNPVVTDLEPKINAEARSC